jgi:hypothetical protein
MGTAGREQKVERLGRPSPIAEGVQALGRYPDLAPGERSPQNRLVEAVGWNPKARSKSAEPSNPLAGVENPMGCSTPEAGAGPRLAAGNSQSTRCSRVVGRSADKGRVRDIQKYSSLHMPEWLCSRAHHYCSRVGEVQAQRHSSRLEGLESFR